MAACGDSAPQSTSVRQQDAREILVEPAKLVLQAGGKWQLAAQVNDAQGQPIGGAEILYRAGDQTIAAVRPLGLVNATGAAGSTFIEVVSGALSARVPVLVVAGPAADLALVQAPAAGVPAGASLGAVQLQVHDQFDNPVRGIEIAWRVLSGAGTLDVANSTSDENGFVSVQWQAGQQAGAQVLEARADGLEPLLIESSAVAGPPVALRLETDPPVADEALPLATVLKVRAIPEDRYGNAVTGTTVLFEATGGCALQPVRSAGDGTAPPAADWPLSTSGRCKLWARIEGSPVETQLAVRIARRR